MVINRFTRRCALSAGAAALLATPALAQSATQSLPGAGPGYPSYYPASYKDIVSAAEKEGKVTIYSSINAPNSKMVWADFQAMYPGVQLNVVNLASAEVYNRFLSEDASGTYDGDILWSNAMDLQMRLARDGKALAYASPEKAYLPGHLQYGDMLYAATMDPDVIFYNKRLLPAALVPKTHDDLLRLLTEQRQMLQGKFVTYDVQITGSAYLAAVYDSRKWPRFWNFVDALGKVDTRYYQSGGTIVELVAAGQFALGYNVPFLYALLREQTDPNVGHVLPTDYTLTLSLVLMIAKHAPHPNAAKLLLDYLLSRRGQQLVSKTGFLVGVRSDITGPATFSAIRAQVGDRLSPIPVDPSLLDVLNPAERLPFLRRWEQGAHGS